MNAEAIVRPATADDSQAIGQLINTIQRDVFAIPITLAEQPDLANVDAYYRTGAGDFWVAECADRIVGTIALIDIGRGDGALRKMFVHKDFRGRERAIAGCLLDALLGHARAQGLARIYLGTTAKFLAAHRFYEKHGFKQVETDTLPDAFPRMAVDTRFYAIDL